MKKGGGITAFAYEISVERASSKAFGRRLGDIAVSIAHG